MKNYWLELNCLLIGKGDVMDSIVKGILTIFTFGGYSRELNRRMLNEKTDSEKIKDDWIAIGKDFEVINSYFGKNKQKKG